MVDYLKNAGLSCILLAVEKKLRRKENNDRPAEPILPQSGLFRQWEARAGEHQEVQQEGEALLLCNLSSDLRGHQGYALLPLADAGLGRDHHSHPAWPRLPSPSHRAGL